MKKVLALVLAFVMVAGLATVAMAAEPLKDYAPTVVGGPYTISSKGVIEDAPNPIEPGTTIYYLIEANNAALAKDGAYNLDYHKVSVEVVEDSKLFDDAKIVTKTIKNNDEGVQDTAGTQLAVDKAYYFLQVTTKDNMSVEDQEFEIEVQLKKINSKVTVEDAAAVTLAPAFAYADGEVKDLFGVGNEKTVVDASLTDDDWTEVDMFLGNNDAHFVSKMYKQGDFFIAVDEDAQEKYEELYGDEAALEYLWVTMPKGLKQAGTLYIPAAMIEDDKAPYLYEEKDGKLVEIKNAYDEENEEFVLKNVKTIGKYVISDIELEVKDSVDGDATEENPATGANDVVAIAAGLAVVSLVAAGAVSLKK